MKSFALLIVLFCCSVMQPVSQLYAQHGGDDSQKMPSRANYIGLTIGPSFPTGDYADENNGLAETGLHANLINLGYFFSDNIGISAIWFGASNPIYYENIDPWSYGGLLAGPLFKFPLGTRMDWDFRILAGYTNVTVPDIGYGPEDAGAFALDFGSIFRIHIGPMFSLLAGADYFATKPEFVDYDFEQNISTVSLNFGAAFRMR